MPPPDDRPKRSRLVRLAAGALLLAQDHADKLLRDAAKTAIDQASAEAERQTHRRQATIMAILLAAGRSMSTSLAGAIVAGRVNARHVATKQLRKELHAAGYGGVVGTRPLLLLAVAERHQDDATHAAVAAESLVTQWRGLAVASAAAAVRKEQGAAKGIVRSARLLEPRIRRTAETETAQAYNDEHRESVRAMARYDDAFGETLMREWIAMLDACEACWPMDGIRTGLDDSFPGGEEPGGVHARCRCYEVIVPSEGAAKKAA